MSSLCKRHSEGCSLTPCFGSSALATLPEVIIMDLAVSVTWTYACLPSFLRSGRGPMPYRSGRAEFREAIHVAGAYRMASEYIDIFRMSSPSIINARRDHVALFPASTTCIKR